MTLRNEWVALRRHRIGRRESQNKLKSRSLTQINTRAR